MLPKKALTHKKSLGSFPSSNTMTGFSFGGNTIKGHGKHASQTFSKSTHIPSLNESLQKSSSQMLDNKQNLLVKNILEAKESVKDGKTDVLKELPVLLESCKQELGSLVAQFDNQVKNTSSPVKNIQGYAEALQKQLYEKEKVNQDLLEANKVLAQKNESLSNILATTTDQLGKATSRESSPEDLIDDPMKYTRIHTKRLAHESKSISIQIEKAQILNPYNAARIKAQVGQLREYAIRSHRDRTKKSQSPEENENKNSETSRTGKMLTCESARSLYAGQSTERQNIFKGPYEEGDEQMNMTWHVIHRLVGDLEAYKKTGYEENRKYVEAMKMVEEAAKEKASFLSMIRKYDEMLNENETTMRNSRRKLKELNMLLLEAHAKIQAKSEKEKMYVGAYEELEAVREDLEELKEKKSEVEEEYKHAKGLWRKKEQLLAQEKQQLEKQLEDTKSELMKAVKDLKRIAKKKTRLRSKERAAKTDGTMLKQVENMMGKSNEEVEGLKRELETVKNELDTEKARHSVKLQIHEENYSKHLETIAELRYKIEELTGECEQLRKSNDKDCDTWRMVMKERYSIENPEELFVKYEENESNLKMYVKEKDELLREIDQLRISLEEQQSIPIQHKEVIVETYVERQAVDQKEGSKDSELEAKLAACERTLSHLQQQIAALNQEKIELAAQCENYQSLLEQEKQQSKHQEELLTQYEAKVQELKDQLDESMELITQTKQQIVALEKEKNEVAAQVKESKTQSSKPAEQNKTHESARSSLNEVKIKDLERKLQDSVEGANQLRKQITALENEKTELLDELEQKRILHETTVAEYDKKVKELEHDLGESIELGTHLEKQVETLEKEKKELMGQNDIEKSKVKELEEKIENLKKESKAGDEGKLLEAEANAKFLKEKLALVEQDKEKYIEDIKKYKTELSHMEVKVLEMDAAQANWDDDKKHLEDNMAIITKEKQDLFKKSKEYQDIIEDLKAQLSDLNQQKQTQRRQSVAKRKMTQDSAGKDSTSEVDMLKEQIKFATEDYEELKNEKEILDKLMKIERERADDLERQLNRVKEEYESRIEEYRELLMEFKDDTENQKGKEEELANRCTQLQAICDDFELKCEILTREKEELERDLAVCKEEKKEVQRKLDDFILGGGFN